MSQESLNAIWKIVLSKITTLLMSRMEPSNLSLILIQQDMVFAVLTIKAILILLLCKWLQDLTCLQSQALLKLGVEE